MTMIIDGTNGLTFPDSSKQYNSYYGFKNRIINGAMVIDQRNAGASVTLSAANNTYTLDRWQAAYSQTSKFTVQQNAGSVTPPVGFSKYLGCTSSAATTVGASEYYILSQAIEGFNTADLGWGTANAKTVTLSFWVYSSLTGTFGGAINNEAFNRGYPFSYSIPTANTWTQISVTIAGDTTGTWTGATNGIGMYVFFGLGAGSSASGTAGAWGASGYRSATGAVQVVATNGATFYITGVQLETGAVATAFDYRPYGTELALCQRYYEKTLSQGTTSSTGQTSGALIAIAMSTTQMAAQWTFKQTKRTTPTLTLSSFNGTSGAWASNSSNADFTVTQPWGVGDNGFARLDSTGMTAGAAYWGFAVASAEL